MQDKIVTLKTAKLARKKGLDTELDFGSNCTCYHLKKTMGYNKNDFTSYHVHFQYPDRKEYIFAPTQSLLARWIREKHGIHIEIYCNASGWGYILTKLNGTTIQEIMDDVFFESNEIALEIGLKQALNLIKST
jgi:hypothetical protein